MPPASLEATVAGVYRKPTLGDAEPVVTDLELTSSPPRPDRDSNQTMSVHRVRFPIGLLAQVLLDLASLPVSSEEATEAAQDDPGHEDAEARAEHRPVEPVAARSSSRSIANHAVLR